MKISEKLMKCPFCGGEAGVGQNLKDNHYFVNCIECLSATNHLAPCGDTKEDAIKSWNTRICHDYDDLKEIAEKEIKLLSVENNMLFTETLALQKRIKWLEKIIDRMDEVSSLADENCDEPAIPLSEAVKREMMEEADSV